MRLRLPMQFSSVAGFTIVELLIAMSIFIVIMAIGAQAFNQILSVSSRYQKIEESSTEGVIGLEILRHDLEQAGFGLPWGFGAKPPSTPGGEIIAGTVTYNEATDTTALKLNDTTNGTASSGQPPRAFAGLGSAAAFSSDHFAIKATTVGRSKAAQRWTYIPYNNYSGASGRESRPVSFSSNNPDINDYVTVINSNFNDSTKDKLLYVYPGQNDAFWISYKTNGTISDYYLPSTDQNTSSVYGLMKPDSGTGAQPRMPFNRADFFIKAPVTTTTGDSLPAYCAPLTGVLYKATVNHNSTSSTSAGGAYNYLPLMDCAADMQVVLGWDSSEGGGANVVDTYSTLPSSAGAFTVVGSASTTTVQGWLATAKGVREHLKIIKVYILAQEGKRDAGYTSPVTSFVLGDLYTNGGLTPKTYTLSDAQRNYRWKVFRIVARPKNLSSNQH